MDHEGDLHRADMAHAPDRARRRRPGRHGREGGYTHMLGQAAAMLIPFPAAIAAEFCGGAFPLGLHLGTFAGSAVATLGDGLAVRCLGGGGGGLASNRRFLARAVHTSRQVGGKARWGSDGARFQSLAASQAAAVRGHGERRGLSAFLQRGRDRGGGIGSRGGDTLSARHPVIGIDSSQGYRVSMRSLVGVWEGAREGQFL